MLEEFEDTKGAIRSRKSKKNKTTQWPAEKGEKDKQRSIKHTHQTCGRKRVQLAKEKDQIQKHYTEN
jgi:hypothetical protein